MQPNSFRWIPVTEALPNHGDVVLVWCKSSTNMAKPMWLAESREYLGKGRVSKRRFKTDPSVVRVGAFRRIK